MGDANQNIGDVSRRGFLVMVGSAVLGRFAIPELEMTSDTVEEVIDPTVNIRRVISTPVWGEKKQFLLWVEQSGEDEESTANMIWTIESEDELKEAKRFFEAVTWKSWRTPSELRSLLRNPGEWLIRLNLNERYQFVTTADASLLFGNDEADTLSEDPADGVRVTSAQALELIPRLCKDWDVEGPDDPYYFEPVKFEVATMHLWKDTKK